MIGYCSFCNEKKSTTVSGNTKLGEGFQDFFKNLDKKGLNISKRMAKNVLRNPTRALDITANNATAAVSRNLEGVMSTLPELLTVYNTIKGLYLGQFV